MGHKKPEEYSKNDDYVLLELLDACAFLKQKSTDLECARKKVSQDVAKLIRNQESFENRVKEMDGVYTML